jgi:hypothetical protein
MEKKSKTKDIRKQQQSNNCESFSVIPLKSSVQNKNDSWKNKTDYK